MDFDYFYNCDGDRFNYVMLPKLLITGDVFKGLSSDAKILYACLLERIGLSFKNGWIDKENRVYIIFTIDEVMKVLNKSNKTTVKILNELDKSSGGIGLVERKRQELGKCICQVKNGKTFHLIINHDEIGENAMLLTEVSEGDLLNMIKVEEDDTPTKVDDVETQEVVKEEPVKEEKSNIGTYVVMALALILALGDGYYFKVVKKKEDEELASFEEPDDDFISEAEDMNGSEDEENDFN